MKTVKATKTARYAQDKPYLPQYLLLTGVEYELPDRLADRVVEVKGGTIVVAECETPEDPTETLETPEDPTEEIVQESKPKKKKGHR